MVGIVALNVSSRLSCELFPKKVVLERLRQLDWLGES